jgi:hypothetical protein
MPTPALPIEDSPYKLDHYGPVFILGCPRSGTTFLSECLGAIRGVEEFVGVLCPPRMCHLLATEDRPDREEVLLASIRDVFWGSFWRQRYARSPRLIQLLRGRLPFRVFLRPPTLDGALFCYKEPFLCFAADKVARHFPNARFIHIVRDGRDNADSLERTYPDALSDEVIRSAFLSANKNSEIGPWRTHDGVNVPWWVPTADADRFGRLSRYERCVLMWREMTRGAQEVGKVAPGRYLELRYEDLVREPVRWGREVAAFIGREFDRKAHRAFGRAVTASVGISRRNQDADRIRKADQIAGPLLRELGYEVGPELPPDRSEGQSSPLRRPAVGGQPLVAAAPGAGV